MTPERITLAGLVLSFIGKVIADWMRTQRAEAEHEAKAEAERIAARDKTQRENEGWLRAKVDELVAHDRARYEQALATYEANQAAMQREIDDLRAALAIERAFRSEVPPLVEELALIIARISPDSTPTPAQMDRLRSKLTSLGARHSLATDLLLTKANP